MTFLGDRISESVSGETAAMTVSVYGILIRTLIDRTARAVASRLREMQGAADVQFDDGAGVPMLSVSLLPERLAQLGLRPADVYAAISAAYAGTVVSQVYAGSVSMAVRVLLPEEVRADPAALQSLSLKTAAGRVVPLGAVAVIELESGRERVSHERGQRRQVVTLNPDTPDLAGFVTEARQALEKDVPLPPGVFLDIGGNAAEAAAASRALILHSAIALLGIVVVLLFAFGAWQGAVLVLVNAPFALVGAVVAIAVTGATLSIGTLVGLVTLFGISARNSIMLRRLRQHLVRAEGHRWCDMLARRGARERITPS